MRDRVRHKGDGGRKRMERVKRGKEDSWRDREEEKSERGAEK